RRQADAHHGARRRPGAAPRRTCRRICPHRPRRRGLRTSFEGRTQAMTYAIGNDTTLGIACLGITHPHTSGRVKAFQRMPNAKVIGAFDNSPLLDSFVEAMGIEKRTKEEILADPDVHAVLIHPKSYLMADWAIAAMEAGKA